jgi:outer membrane protein assembly factor BamB
MSKCTNPNLILPNLLAPCLRLVIGMVLCLSTCVVFGQQVNKLSGQTTVKGGASATLTVTLTKAAPTGGLSVALASNSVAATPTSHIVVAAGSTYTTFTVPTIPVSTNQTVTITASGGGGSAAATFVVDAPVLTSVTLAPTSIAGGGSVSGFAHIGSAAPAGGLPVALASDSAFAQVPTSVLIPAGATVVEFQVTTSAVSVSRVANISGTLGGVTSSAPLAVTAPILTSISLSPTSVSEGGTSKVTVTLSSVAPTGGFAVPLVSSVPAAASGATVTVAAGLKTGTGVITTGVVAATTTVAITPSTASTPSASLTVTIPTVTGLSLNPTTVVGGNSSVLTVTLSAVAPPGGFVVPLQSDQTFAVVGAATIAAGSKTGTTTVTTSQVAVNGTANVSVSSGGSPSVALSVVAPKIIGLGFTPASVVGGKGNSVGKITLSANAPNGGLVIALTSNSLSATVPATVILPAGSNAVSFTVTTKGVNSTTSALISASVPAGTFPASLTLLPGVLSSIKVPATLVGGGTGTGTVAVSVAAGPGGSVVSLSSNQSSISVPNMVTVPQGSTSASFTITCGTVGAITSATISASFGGVSLSASSAVNVAKWTSFRANASGTGSGGGVGGNAAGIGWTYVPHAGSLFFDSSAAVIGLDGSTYVGGDAGVYSVSSTGARRWLFATPAPVESSPALATSVHLFVGCDDGNVYSISSGGTKVWAFQTGSAVISSPVIGPDGTVYVGSLDGTLYALNQTTGALIWSYQTGGSIESSPAVANGMVYFGAYDYNLYALNSATGDLVFKVATGSYITSSPALDLVGNVYVGSFDGKLYSINGSSGAVNWTVQTGSFIRSSPAVTFDGSTIYVGSMNGYLYSVGSNGVLNWAFVAAGGGIESSPAIGADGQVYFGSDNHKLYSVSPVGIQTWSLAFGDVVLNSPSIGPDGALYLAVDDTFFKIVQ